MEVAVVVEEEEEDEDENDDDDIAFSSSSSRPCQTDHNKQNEKKRTTRCSNRNEVWIQ